MKNFFQLFTNQYELSKTLRFELRPIENTAELLKKNKIFEKDKKVYEYYQKTKKYFDKLHCEFIDEALVNTSLPNKDYSIYDKLFFEYKKDKENKKIYKALNEHAKKLRTNIVKDFEKTAEKWRDEYILSIKDEKSQKKLKQLEGLDLLFKTEVFDFLKKKYPEAQIEGNSIFDSFNKFFTYFDNFHQSRKNFYKDDGTASAIPTRIIDDNLPKFLENKKIFEEEYKVLNLSREEKDLFRLDFYNKCFTQTGIENYNEIVSKINSKVNKYRQKNKKSKIHFMKELFKQILSKRSKQATEQDTSISIENDSQVFEVLQDFIMETKNCNRMAKNILETFIQHQEEFDLQKVFLKGSNVTRISDMWFTSWFAFGDLLPKNSTGKKLANFISFQDIKNALEKTEIQDVFKKKYAKYNKESFYDQFLQIFDYEFHKALNDCEKNIVEAEKMMKVDKVYSNKKGILRNGKNGEKQKEIIKDFADSALSIYQMMKYFALEKGKKPVTDMDEDPRFYNDYKDWCEKSRTLLYYNEFRNYLTKKPYAEDKIKLNFEKSTLLMGWSANEEGNLQYYSSILRKDNKYYLGLMSSASTFNINKKEAFETRDGFYELMNYRQLKSTTIYGSLYKGEYKKEYRKDKETLTNQELIERTKKILEKQKFSYPQLEVILDKKYKAAEDLAKDLGNIVLYNIGFVKISKRYVNNLTNENFYLFEISNKDFLNKKKKGNVNLHTKYFQLLFDKKNLESKKGAILKLSGGGEVFYRKATKNLPKKKDKKGKEIIDRKRYAEDKILFHLPIVLNIGFKDKQINSKVNQVLATQRKARIIGIDRGEKHLLYISVIDENANILKIKSLNTIDVPNKKEPDDYHKLLDEKEKERDDERKSWHTIENIKELKHGYISQVVNEIDKIIFECLDERILPIIVFEDLNIGFKRGRFKIEKQVYQKFELALAKKLNYLVSKEKGNYLNAFQFTPPVNNFQDIHKKQVGIIFYIPASFTSAICPVCGFRKRLYGFTFKNINQVKKLLAEHEFNIFYDGKRFNFECLASKENEKKENKNGLYTEIFLNKKLFFNSDIERLFNKKSKDNKKWETISFIATEELKKLFEGKIDLKRNIMDQILAGDFRAEFYQQLIFIINRILNLRNCHAVEHRDFIACPSCGFHSEKNYEKLKSRYAGKEKFEFNGDANGAYNIARKGILLIKKIRQFAKSNNIEKLMPYDHLQIDMQEWDKFCAKNKS